MNFTVLSLFDGLGGTRIALNNLNFSIDYFASEIDKYCIKVSQQNYSDITHLGNVQEIDFSKLPSKINLLIGGSPCQDLSASKTTAPRKGLQGSQSCLFFDYLEVRDRLNPKYFVLENVYSMGPKNRKIITDYMGVEPVMIDSKNFSAQNRKRSYWCNFEINNPYQPNTQVLKDILEVRPDKKYLIPDEARTKRQNSPFKQNRLPLDQNKKCTTLTRGMLKCIEIKKDVWRVLTPIEYERLQVVPDNYTAAVSNTQRVKMLCNGFTTSVIEYILRHIPEIDSSV